MSRYQLSWPLRSCSALASSACEYIFAATRSSLAVFPFTKIKRHHYRRSSRRATADGRCYNAAMWNNVGMIIGNFVAMLVGIGVLYGVVSLSDSPNFERYRDF